jgi:two-component system cell cycle sensor histidine kinase/response regulator CckA
MSVFLVRNGKYVYGNPTGIRMLGYKQSREIEGLDVMASISAEFQAVIKDRIKRVEQGRSNPPMELGIVRPDGETIRTLSASVSLELDGELTAVVVSQDISAIKAMERQLVQQERLASVGQLAAGIAHDFNNILASILGFAELMQIAPDTPPQMRPGLTRIVNSSRRAAHLVRQLLDFSQKTHPNLERFELDHFGGEMVDFLQRTIPETIKISLEVAPGHYQIEADPTQLQQVMTNLALNAADAMPAGGELRINLKQCQATGKVACDLCGKPIEAGWFCLMVSDTGSGITEAVLPHIFEPFFTTRPVGQGSGLGLSQVYGIVRQHHGSLEVNSRVNQGTSISIHLPPSAQAAAAVRPGEKPPMMTGQHKTVLLVEDDPSVLEVSKSMLEQLEYQVLTAGNGQEALTVYQEHQAEIAVVLSDMVMPDMGGEVLFEALKAENPAVKMILMSGYPSPEKARELLTKGAVAWLDKPASLRQLAAAVAKAASPNVGRWQ